MARSATANHEAIEAWNGPLFDRYLEFREVFTTGLGAHGDVALGLYPLLAGQRVLDVGCGFGDATQQIAALVGPDGEAVGVDAAARFIEMAHLGGAAGWGRERPLRGLRCRRRATSRTSRSMSSSRASARCSSPIRWPRCATCGAR